MQIKLDISSAYTTPCVVIQASEVTPEIQALIAALGGAHAPLVAEDETGRTAVLQPDRIALVRVERGRCALYGERARYVSKKRLFELEEQLGAAFMRINKGALVNLAHLDSVEAGFNTTLKLNLDNGCSDYVTRTYLPAFKRYLGL